MKPYEQLTPEEVVACLDAALKNASVDELIGALAVLSGARAMALKVTVDETSKRRLIRLLVARLAVRTMSPEYYKE